MKYCTNCQKHLPETTKFCVFCGTALTEEMPTVLQQTEEPVQEPVEVIQEPVDSAEDVAVEIVEEPMKESVNEDSAAEEAPTDDAVEEISAEPSQTDVPDPDKEAEIREVKVCDPQMLLTTFQYILLQILFCIPLVGLVFLFVWSFGRTKNISLKRFARSYLILQLISLFLAMLAAIIALIFHVA